MYKILNTAVALCLTCSFASCSDFLESENKSSVTDEQYFTEKAGFETLVNNSYEHLRDIYSKLDYDTWFNAGTDMYMDGRTRIEDAYQMYETLSPENTNNKELYTYCYQGIRAAQAVINYAADATAIDETLKNKRVDEARALACHFYYILVNNYGGVPLMKDFVKSAERGYARNTAAEVYDYIISELESVIADNYLESSTAVQGGGRLSMESVRGILAKTYLAAAWDLGKADYYAKAAQMADNVINGRKLTTSYADLWRANGSGDDNAEFLWDVEYDFASATNTTTGGNQWSSMYCNYLGGNEDNVKTTHSNFIPTVYTHHCFEKGDVRYGVTFMKELPEVNNGNTYGTGYWTWYKNGESLKGYPVKRYYKAWYETDADVAAWRAVDPANRAKTYVIPMDEKTIEPQELTGAAMTYEEMVNYAFGGVPCRKFDDSNTASTQDYTDYRDIHIMTLPEMYLLAAEAYYKAGDNAKALARLNTVRERAGLSDANTIDIDVILKERACEMFGNSPRWIDLRRTQKLIEHNDLYNPSIAGQAAARIGQKTLRPIPQAVIDANDALTDADQNPGY